MNTLILAGLGLALTLATVVLVVQVRRRRALEILLSRLLGQSGKQ